MELKFHKGKYRDSKEIENLINKEIIQRYNTEKVKKL